MGKKRGGGEMCIFIIELILCLFLPPLAVLIQRGCSKDFWLNLLLTLLIWIPGVIHAFYLIITGEEKRLDKMLEEENQPAASEAPASSAEGGQAQV